MAGAGSGAGSGAGEALQQAQATVPWRAWQRYGSARGGVLAGGIAYAGFFSLFPALAFGFTIFGIVLGNNTELQTRVVESVNSSFGTAIIKTSPTAEGIVELSQLTDGSTLTLWGVLGAIGMLLTGLGWLDAIRSGVRAMFGQPQAEGNLVRAKLRDTLVLATLGLVVLGSAITGFVVNSATGWLLETVGLSGSLPGRLLLGGVGVLLLLAVDIAVFVVLFQLLSGVSVPRQDLLDAAVFGGIGLGLLKVFGGILLNGASNNTFLLSAGLLLGLLVWLNLVSRLTLVAAAWGAIVAMDRGHLAAPASPVESGLAAVAPPRAAMSPPRAAMSPPRAAVAPPRTPVVSTRAADRVSVAAGAILGAGALLAVHSTSSAIRALAGALRSGDDD
jgi:membrane protein